MHPEHADEAWAYDFHYYHENDHIRKGAGVRVRAVRAFGATPPVANFTGTPTSGTAPLTVNFTDQSTNTPTSWQWEFWRWRYKYTRKSNIYIQQQWFRCITYRNK